VIATTFSNMHAWMIVGIVGLLVVLVFLALAEMSLSQMTKPRAAALLEQGVRSGKALTRLAEQPTLWVNPLLLTVNVCQTIQATLTGIVAGDLFGPLGVVIGVVLNVVLFFVVAEAVPKTYALLHPVKGATLTARPVELLVRFWPLRLASNLLIKLTNVIVKGEGLKQGPFIGESEFLGIVEAAAQDSVIEHEERELIESIIEFGDTVVREIMRPRPDIVSVDFGSTIDAAIDEAFEHGVSRMPVMSEDEDGNQDVVGIAYTKDLMKRIRAGEGSQSVDSLIRPAVVIPENKPVAKLMREMQRDHFHMAIVADEYGSITGLVTLEDCLEELVGEIVDEHDDEDPMVRSLPNGESLVDAGMAISEFNDHFETKLDEDEFDTVGGFLFGILEHVPVTGESLEIDGWRFVVDELEGRRITKVRVLPVVDVE